MKPWWNKTNAYKILKLKVSLLLVKKHPYGIIKSIFPASNLSALINVNAVNMMPVIFVPMVSQVSRPADLCHISDLRSLYWNMNRWINDNSDECATIHSPSRYFSLSLFLSVILPGSNVTPLLWIAIAWMTCWLFPIPCGLSVWLLHMLVSGSISLSRLSSMKRYRCSDRDTE